MCVLKFTSTFPFFSAFDWIKIVRPIIFHANFLINRPIYPKGRSCARVLGYYVMILIISIGIPD